jgi:hypothetical protein
VCVAGQALGETTAADALRADAWAWVQQTVLPGLPPPFIEGLMQRHAAVRELLAWARRG